MVRFAATDKETGRPVLGIGLSRENVAALMDGTPTRFSTTEMGMFPHAIEVFVFTGETDITMMAAMVKQGVLRPENITDNSTPETLATSANIQGVD